ncbi:MAG: V-type ATP synthase subunit A, partial [Clostridia bacterium]|nr:V-type ATP synthase subunit A [Clostridia bacterium]
LHQNAFHEVDTYASPQKQAMLLRLIIAYYEKSVAALDKDASFSKLASLPVREEIGRFKYVEEDESKGRFDEIMAALEAQIGELTQGGEE